MKKTSLKKAAVLLLLASGMLFTASCTGKKTVNTGDAIAEPDGRDYTFTYSSDWSVLRDDSMYAIESPASEVSGKTANVSVLFAVIDEDLADYADAEDGNYYSALLDKYVPEYMQAVCTEFGSTAYDGNISDIEIDKTTGKLVSYSWKDPVTEEEFFFETVFALLPTTEYTYCYYLTYTANGKDTFDEFHGGFAKVLSSFSFN